MTWSDFASSQYNDGSISISTSGNGMCLDGTLYSVGKALDGNCWMLQNLKLGKNSSSLTLTPADSNVPPAGFILTGKSPDGVFHAYAIDNAPNQNNGSEYYCTDDYGCYYNWHTATASSGTTSVTTGNVNYSICPTGWVLPTGGTGGQFGLLYREYNSSTLMLVDNPTTTTENTINKIPGFLLSGYGDSTGFNHASVTGNYWSRTAYNNGSSFTLRIYASSISNPYAYTKYMGSSVRCLAQ